MTDTTVKPAVNTDIATARAGRRPWAWFLGAVVVAALVAAFVLVWMLRPAYPGDTSPEAGFARDMFMHHEQAVEMSFLIRDRSTDPVIQSISTDMILTQMSQMGQMLGWLDVWGLPLTGSEPPMTWMGHGGMPMPGMASREEMDQLASLEGTEAEILFLQLMIRHHLGGVPMAEEILRRSDNPVTTRMATSIINAQTIEVENMDALLEERGAERLPG